MTWTRANTTYLFLIWRDVTKNKRAIKNLAPFITSGVKQFKSKKRVFTDIERKSIFGNFFLAAKGYEKLGFSRQEVQNAFPENGKTRLPIKFTKPVVN